jgi:hypothetical protein
MRFVGTAVRDRRVGAGVRTRLWALNISGLWLKRLFLFYELFSVDTVPEKAQNLLNFLKIPNLLGSWKLPNRWGAFLMIIPHMVLTRKISKKIKDLLKA